MATNLSHSLYYVHWTINIAIVWFTGNMITFVENYKYK